MFTHVCCPSLTVAVKPFMRGGEDMERRGKEGYEGQSKGWDPVECCAHMLKSSSEIKGQGGSAFIS